MHRPRAERTLALLRPASLALLLCAGLRAWAQQEPAADTAPLKPALQVVPRVRVAETFTDNANLATTNRRDDQITEVSPGIRLSQDSGRVVGYLDYALRALAYAQGSQSGTLLHALDSAGQVDAWSNWLMVDFGGNISQQSVSPFGPLAGSNSFGTANSAEWSHFTVSPFVRGVLDDQVNYVARLRRSLTHSNTALSSDVGESLGSIDLGSGQHLGRLGWVMDASRYDVDYSGGRATEADQVDVGLSLAFTTQLVGVVKAGREASNYTTPDKQTYATSDASLSWQASPQLQASASIGQRSFGNIHAVDVEYRTPRISVRLADRRDVSAVPGQVLPVLLIPIAGGPPVLGSFVTTALAIQNRQDLQLSYLGLRDTVTLGLSVSENSRLDTLSQTTDAIAFTKVRQSGLSLGCSHRLTPRYSLDLLAALQQASGAPLVQDSVLHELYLTLNARLGRDTRAFVGLRHAVFTGLTPYEENALTLGLTTEF